MSTIGQISPNKAEDLRSRYGGGGGYNWDFLGNGGGGHLPKGPGGPSSDSMAPGMCDPLGASAVDFDSWGMDGMMEDKKPHGGKKTKGRSRTGRTSRSRRSRRSRRGANARRSGRARRGRRARRTRAA